MKKHAIFLAIMAVSLFPLSANAANKYAVASGAWSSTDTWSDTDGGGGGAAVPADGDAVFISAAVNVLMDADLSSYTGLQTVTIRGGATPGKLYFADGTSGYLKIRTGYNLVGTTSTNKGRLLANSNGTWGGTTALAYANKAVIDLQGTSILDATNLDIALYCTQPSNLYVATYGSIKTVTGSASADTLTNAGHGWANGTPLMVRVTGGSLPSPLVADTLYWVVETATDTFKLAAVSGGTAIDLTTDGSGTIEAYDGHSNTGTATINVLADITGDSAWGTTDGHDRAVLVDAGPADYDQQRIQLNTIAAGSITLSANVDSAQYPGARIYLSSRNVSIRSAGTSTSQAIISTSTGNTFRCEITNTAGSGTTFYGYGLNGSNNNTISGVISGCTYGLNGSSNTISGVISGCTYGLSSSSNNTISGVISGCTNGLSSSNNNTISGVISGCTYGLNGSNNNTISGVISGCSYGLNGSSNNTISGVISGCTYQVRFSGYGNNYFKNALTGTFSFYGRNMAYTFGRAYVENLNRANGVDIVYDAFGDIARLACGSGGDAPPVDPLGGTADILAAQNLQSNLSTVNPLIVFDGFRIWMTAAEHTVTFKVNTTFAGIAAGGLTLTASYISTGGARAESTNAPAINQRASASDWTQTLAVTFTPTVAGWVEFKLVLTEYESGNEVYVWPTPSIT